MTRATDFNLNAGLVLSIPMFEGTGTATLSDVAKPHHPMTLVHSPVWTQLPSGLWVLQFVSAGGPDFIQCAAASSIDLNFTSESFSVVMWINAADGTYTLVRRGLDSTDGWNFFRADPNKIGLDTWWPTQNETMTGNNAFLPSVWVLVGFTRVGTLVTLYVNGSRGVIGSQASHVDPASANRKLLIGVSNNETSLPFNGYMDLPHIWNRALSPAEHMQIFNAEREFFGV